MEPGEKLRRYLKDNGILQRDAHVALGISLKSMHLQKIMRGFCNPRIDLAFKIEKFTGGAIKAVEFSGMKEAA
jgi:hypothetical protein